MKSLRDDMSRAAELLHYPPGPHTKFAAAHVHGGFLF
jgi:hypothetical protein